jgi:hypothetical protein
VEIRSETITLNGGVRLLGGSRGACTVCDADVRTVREHPGRRVSGTLIGVHGPRDARCAGSRQPGRPWIEACHLPAWEALSDHDKGQSLAFEWKAYWERSFSYARENYPPDFEHPALRQVADLPSVDNYVSGTYYTSHYAASVVSSLGEPLERVPNPWKDAGWTLRPEPSTIREPLIFMAQRILGEDEVARLQDVALTAAGAR